MTDTTLAAVRTPEVVQLEPRTAAVVDVTGAAHELPSLLAGAFELTMRQVATAGGQVTGPPFARYVSFGDTIEAEVGFPCTSVVPADGVRETRLPGGRAVLLTHVGPYEEIHMAWSHASRWMQEHGLEQASAGWESYLTGPDDAGRPVTQIVFPIR